MDVIEEPFDPDNLEHAALLPPEDHHDQDGVSGREPFVMPPEAGEPDG